MISLSYTKFREDAIQHLHGNTFSVDFAQRFQRAPEVDDLGSAVVGLLIAMVIGFALGLMATGSKRALRVIARVYVEFFQNTPLILQVCFLYYALAYSGVKITVVENTAVAAKMVAQSEDPGVAALSSRFCAEHYGLQTLQANVQDQDNNYTRFICISKKPEIYPGADRTSFMMIISHKPGSLYNVLSKFYALGINLRKLESRPLPDREFEFMFYFDIESSVYAPEMEKLFLDLESESEEFRYLGTYNEVIC